MIEAPSRRIASTLAAGAVSITMTEQGAPTLRAASATPCAAFPALTVQTPSFSSSGDSCLTTLYAPRILNEPIGCSTSSFRYSSRTGAPGSSSTRTSGVRTAAA